MRALIIEGDRQIADVLGIHLKNELGFVTNYRSSLREALELLKEDSAYELIIVRNIIGGTKTEDGEEAARGLCTFLYDKSIKTSILVLGSFEYVGMPIANLPDHFKLNEFVRVITKLLNLTRHQISDMKLPDFVPVPISYFYLMNRSSCDIYMKLKKGDEEEFVKRIHAEDEFDKEAIKRYNTRFGLQEFYIRKDDRDLFFDSLLVQSEAKLTNPTVSVELKLEMVADSFGIARSLLNEAGIDERSVKMASATIESMKQTIASADKLSDLLKKLLTNPSTYAYKHSFMISLFFPKLLSKMEWCPQSQLQNTLDKMIFISFFHDIALDDDRLVMIDDKESFRTSELSNNEKVFVLHHANKAASLVQSFPHSPPGADVIIRQHHGMSNGVGFPDSYGISISPISILFIIIEAFVHELLNIPETKKKVPQIVQELYVRFPMGTYKKIIDILKESLSSDF